MAPTYLDKTGTLKDSDQGLAVVRIFVFVTLAEQVINLMHKCIAPVGLPIHPVRY